MFFPLMNRIWPDIRYINGSYGRKIHKLLHEYTYFGLKSTELKQLMEALSGDKVFISWEGLNHWNPRCWEKSARKNLELFSQRCGDIDHDPINIKI